MTKRILVVEDHEDNRQIIRDMLAATDYEITEAENGEQALAAIAKQRPDLILMDIQLPIMDGYEVTRRIKADPALRSIPIIAVTSYALSGEEQKARAAGCDEYVPKPYSPRQCWRKFVSTCPRWYRREAPTLNIASSSSDFLDKTACAFATTQGLMLAPSRNRPSSGARRQAGASRKGEVHLSARRARGDFQRFIGNIEDKCFV